MKKTKHSLPLISLVILLLTIAGYTISFAGSNNIYLPIVMKENTPTPAPTVTSSPTPTTTSSPTPTATAIPANVIVVSSNAFIPYEGSSSLYIVGEVLNNTGSNVQFVRINGTLRNESGNVVGSNYTYSDISILSPGMKSPFLMIFIDPLAWVSYELTVNWNTTSAQPYPMQILNSTSYFDSFDAFHVVGEISNQYSEARTFIEAYVTLYEGNGHVIGVGSSFTNPYDLNPGQTASFDTDVYFWKGKPDHNQVASFSLQVIDD